MGSIDGVKDGRIDNNSDKEELQKLIGELREKTLKEIGKSRLHFKLALDADEKRERCEERLEQLGFHPNGMEKDKAQWLRNNNK